MTKLTREKTFIENIMGKGENAVKHHFLLFPQCFLLFPKEISIDDKIKATYLLLFCRQQML